MPSQPSVILVVEDEAIVRLDTASLLDDAGFAVAEAENADHAIAILEARADIGLVLTDVEMPGSMNGLRLAAYVRDRWPPIQLIVASGKGLAAQDFLPHGVVFLAKPYLGATLTTAVRDLVAHGRTADG